MTGSQSSLGKALDLTNSLQSAAAIGHRVVLASADAQLRRDQIEESRRLIDRLFGSRRTASRAPDRSIHRTCMAYVCCRERCIRLWASDTGAMRTL